jgi:hypothetical protein
MFGFRKDSYLADEYETTGIAFFSNVMQNCLDVRGAGMLVELVHVGGPVPRWTIEDSDACQK